MKFKLLNSETKEIMMDIEAIASGDAALRALEALGYHLYVHCEAREYKEGN